MKQLGFLIHLDKCLGCSSCRFSCHHEHGHTDLLRRKVHDVRGNLGKTAHSDQHISISCNHCENPACMFSCPVGAIQKKLNGVVLIDKMKCNGCRKCELACPFQAIHIDPMSRKADKCDMCYDRLMQGQTTVCVSSCPVKAIEIIDIHKPKDAKYEKEADGFELKKVTNPSIRFTQKKE